MPGKTAALPPKYGIWWFGSINTAMNHNIKQRLSQRYNFGEYREAYYHPSILHFVTVKPWKFIDRFKNEWWNYAKISGYYNDIYNKTQNLN